MHVLFLQGKKIDSTPLAMYNFFIERVKSNLHVALAMSPIGDAFRNRLRMFPSLINCCTIDWFQVRNQLYMYILANDIVIPLVFLPTQGFDMLYQQSYMNKVMWNFPRHIKEYPTKVVF